MEEVGVRICEFVEPLVEHQSCAEGWVVHRVYYKSCVVRIFLSMHMTQLVGVPAPGLGSNPNLYPILFVSTVYLVVYNFVSNLTLSTNPGPFTHQDVQINLQLATFALTKIL